jgi:hypothetical protein
MSVCYKKYENKPKEWHPATKLLKKVFRIRIHIDFCRLDPYPDPGGQKKTTKKIEEVKKFHVVKSWMFSFQGVKASAVPVLGRP